MSKLLTTKDLQEVLQVTRQSLYNWREEGMPHIMVGSLVRYELDEVMKWLKEQNKKEEQL